MCEYSYLIYTPAAFLSFSTQDIWCNPVQQHRAPTWFNANTRIFQIYNIKDFIVWCSVLNRDSFRKRESGRLVSCCKRSSSLGVLSEAFISRDYGLHQKKQNASRRLQDFKGRTATSLKIKNKKKRCFRGQVNKYDKHKVRTWKVACLKEIFKSLRRRINTRSLQRPSRF